MGKSRSAAVCTAFLLHRNPSDLTPQTALQLLQKSRPLADPNLGFMRQLSLYQQMGCPVQDDEALTQHPLYTRWLYHREVEDSVACGRAPEMDSVLFEDEQQRAQSTSSSKSNNKDNNKIEKIIKCRRCRRTLATTPFLVSHTNNNNNDDNDDDDNSLHNPACGHIFLHALTWMRPFLFPATESQREKEENPLSGRLSCPNCGSHIGKFAWAGLQCTCGKWVVPALALVKGRVDIVDHRSNNVPSAMGIRLPPSMRMGNNNNNSGGGEHL